MKYLCIILFLAISISSCQQQAVNEKCEKNIIVCFDHYHPKPYKTPGGVDTCRCLKSSIPTA